MLGHQGFCLRFSVMRFLVLVTPPPSVAESLRWRLLWAIKGRYWYWYWSSVQLKAISLPLSHYLPFDYREKLKVKVKVKVKFTLKQATKAQRGSRCIALLFNLGARWGGWSKPRPGRFTPRERPGTHCIGGWVGLRAVLDGCGKSRPPPEFDPRTVQPVASRYTATLPFSPWVTP